VGVGPAKGEPGLLRRYQSLLAKLYIVHDLALAGLALVLAWWLRFDLLPDIGAHLGVMQSAADPLERLLARALLARNHYSFSRYISILLVALPAFGFGGAATGLYGTTRNNRTRSLAVQILKSTLMMALIGMSLLFFENELAYSREVLGLFSLMTWLFVLVGRMVVRRFLGVLREQGYNRKFVLIVGVTSATARFLEQLDTHGELGYQVVGYLDLEERWSEWVHASTAAFRDTMYSVAATMEKDSAGRVKEVLATRGIPCLGGLDQLDAVLGDQIVDHIILTVPHEASSLLAPLIGVAEAHGVHALLVPDFLDILPSRPKFEDFAGLPIVDTRYTPLDDAINGLLKRTFDIVFSAIVLVILSPLFAAIAVAVKLTSPGPVIYRQERLGKNRRVFRMYKFRSMRVGAEEEAWTVVRDPRRTSIGAFLRTTSLDELPQFWNVLRGDMSVIGPRPERPHFVEQFRTDVPRYMIKHRVRPGITGWAQVNGLRGDTSIEERIEYDLRYIEDWSFAWDLRIVLLTVWKGMHHKNAY